MGCNIEDRIVYHHFILDVRLELADEQQVDEAECRITGIAF